MSIEIRRAGVDRRDHDASTQDLTPSAADRSTPPPPLRHHQPPTPQTREGAATRPENVAARLHPVLLVFTELPLAEKVSGFVDWLLGGWATSIPEHAVDNYIGDARDARI